MKFIIVDTGSDSSNAYYKRKFSDFHSLEENQLCDINTDNNDFLLIIGYYKKVENFNGYVSWLITDNNMIDYENLSIYDKVDNFLGTDDTYLIERYGKFYVHEEKDILFSFRTSAPVYLSSDKLRTTILNIFMRVISIIRAKNEIKIINELWAGKSLYAITPINNRNTITWNSVKETILYSIVGDPQDLFRNDLFYDFHNKSFYYFLSELVVYLYANYKIKIVDSNLSLINVNFQNVHRSGWQYIINGLASLKPKQPVIIDTYIDKTFGWSCSFYENNNDIPYKTPWYGFLHHTQSEDSQFYNIKKLFINKQFIKSLPNCMGIIVFSHKLRDELLNLFSLSCLEEPTIYVLPYPTLLNTPLFDFDKFISNNNPYLVQIGTWLRDLFAIYRLELDPSSKIKKAIIDPIDLSVINTQCISSKMKTICSGDDDIIGDICSYLHQKEDEVSVLYRLDNEDYDSLLEKNLVFLYLKDASAVNVLVECIVRSTPILINPLPAIVEFLGEDYPFYYNSFYEASKKATDIFTINKTHEYLKNLSLERFHISKFLESFNKILNN